MFKTLRNNEPHAVAYSSAGSPDSEELAASLGFDFDKYVETQAWTTRQPYSCDVLVPNTMLFVWTGDCGRLGRWANRWYSEIDYARRLGFRVRELVFDNGGEGEAAEILAAVAEESEEGRLHGLYVVAHGGPDGFGRGDANLWVSYAEMQQALRYKLAFVCLNCCYGGFVDGEDGSLGPGGRDLLSSSAEARFHGVKQVLWPRIFFYFGHAKRVSDLLAPGDQGTKLGG